MWLLFTVLIATASGQSKNVTYTTHIDGTMIGFNPFCMNCFIHPDPGRRSMLFQPLQNPIYSTDDEVLVNPFVNEAEEVKCYPDLIVTTVTSYIEFHKYAASSAYRVSSDVNYESALARFDISTPCETKSNSRDDAMRNFFEGTAGEVVFVKAECVTHTITIEPFEALLFAPAFERALGRLYLAALDPASEASDTTFSDFVKSYGTHFSKRTQIGAKTILGKMFSSRAATVEEEAARRRCVREAAREALTPCMRRCHETILTHFARASSERCGETEQEILASITGLLPEGTMENWASVAEELPDPIFYHLEPISTLFSQQWSSSSAETINIDKTILSNFFNEKISTYNSRMVTGRFEHDRSSGPSSSPHSEQTTTLRPITTTPASSLLPGGIIIIGGSRDIYSETLGTPDLPSFPGHVEANTVSIVGSTVFSCGGFQREYKKKCYYLRAGDLTWSSIALPWELVYHSAVTVQGKMIWFLQNNHLYSYDTAKHDDQFKNYAIQVPYSDVVCAVTNQSHTFIIGAGGSFNEVWVNRDPSKPTEWEKVADLRNGRREHACLWFGSEIFVTGGSLQERLLDSVEVLNVKDMTISNTRSLIEKRSLHQMAVLEGKPAVLGGGEETITIEVYDRTDAWQTLDYTMEIDRRYFGLAQYRP